AAEGVTVPGTVTSNAYRDTKVTALVGGIARLVTVELGAQVERGEPLAVIVSSDLADAQMKYLSMRAMLEADHQKLVRTEKLVTLGAASRQELEEVTAARTCEVRVEVPYPQRTLRLGMFVAMSVETGSSQGVTVVPQAAVQAIGDRTVVYTPVEGEEAKFTARPVKLGTARGNLVQVLEGIKPGEKVVTDGSFFLRGEANRTRSGG